MFKLGLVFSLFIAHTTLAAALPSEELSALMAAIRAGGVPLVPPPGSSGASTRPSNHLAAEMETAALFRAAASRLASADAPPVTPTTGPESACPASTHVPAKDEKAGK